MAWVSGRPSITHRNDPEPLGELVQFGEVVADGQVDDLEVLGLILVAARLALQDDHVELAPGVDAHRVGAALLGLLLDGLLAAEGEHG